MTEINEYRQNLQPLIISEAERLFRKKGIKSVTMEEISKNLHISKRTIYELYTNKENLLIEVLNVSIISNKQHLEDFSRKCDNVMDILIESFRLQLQVSLNTNPDFYYDLEKYPRANAMLNDRRDDERKDSSRFFEKGVSEGYFIPNIDFDVLMRIIYVTKDALRNDAYLKKLTFKDILDNYVSILIRGICTQKGIAQFDEFLNNYKA